MPLFFEKINLKQNHRDLLFSMVLIYDSAKWFEIATKLEVNLLAYINMHKAKSIEILADRLYENTLFLNLLFE